MGALASEHSIVAASAVQPTYAPATRVVEMVPTQVPHRVVLHKPVILQTTQETTASQDVHALEHSIVAGFATQTDFALAPSDLRMEQILAAHLAVSKV